jgi:ribosome maturation factor RimP
MIKKEYIEELVSRELSDEYFVVSITVKKDNRIEIVIDGDNGVSIQKCIDVSRNIEKNLDRESEDFELNVSSYGIGKPLKLHRQYVKNIGQNVEVSKNDEKPVSGILTEVDPDFFVITYESIEREGKKKRKVSKTQKFLFSENPVVKNIISFK